MNHLGVRCGMVWLCVFGLCASSGCNGGAASGQLTAAQPVAKDALPPIRVEIVKPRRRTTVQPAQVEPKERVEVVVKVAGYLKSFEMDLDGKEIDTGSRIKAGQALAKLSVPELEQELKLKQAMFRLAEDGVLLAKEQKNVAVKDRERYQADLDYRDLQVKRHEDLVRDRAVQADVLDEQRKQQKAAAAALGSAGAKIVQSAADIKVAETRVEVARHECDRVAELWRYATVTAPASTENALYIVTRRWADPGAFLQAGAGGQRDAIVSLMRVDQVRVVVHVPELDAARVEAGDPASFLPAALAGQKFEGKVSRFASSLEMPSRTMRVEIDLPNPGGRSLYPGMYGSTTVTLGSRGKVFLLPLAAVRKEDGRAYVYRAVQGTAQRIDLKLGREDLAEVEVIEGLTEETQVIRSAKGALKDGAAIIIDDTKAR